MKVFRPILPALFVAATLWSAPSLAWIHVARAGETLDQLAAQYFGNARFSMVIRAANGFVHPDDGQLIQGERVEVPEVIYHRVDAEDSWTRLADEYLGSPLRGSFLAELNDHDQDSFPAEGTIIKIPYQLLHILAGDESLKTVARMYLGQKRSAEWLRQYNLTKRKRFRRGEVLLVPILSVELVEAERERIETARAERQTFEDKQAQREIVEKIAKIKDTYEAGRYLAIVGMAQQLLVPDSLTVPQQIGVYQFLAFSYVALGARQLALDVFEKALRLQLEMELSPITTSPKIREVFLEAKKIMTSDTAKDQGLAKKKPADQKKKKTHKKKKKKKKQKP